MIKQFYSIGYLGILVLLLKSLRFPSQFKSTRSATVLLCLIFSVSTSALKLNDLTVSSAIGEHFYGVIKLENTRNIAPNNLLVSLAPRSVYQRMDVARTLKTKSSLVMQRLCSYSVKDQPAKIIVVDR